MAVRPSHGNINATISAPGGQHRPIDMEIQDALDRGSPPKWDKPIVVTRPVRGGVPAGCDRGQPTPLHRACPLDFAMFLSRVTNLQEEALSTPTCLAAGWVQHLGDLQRPQPERPGQRLLRSSRWARGGGLRT
mmetsp:Transcript_92880/g.294611  ORF Transcript_92880/g.294611 Transcript_92880/m.294611 type:complete len:133 (+) Transcript_92880:302-700(+)